MFLRTWEIFKALCCLSLAHACENAAVQILVQTLARKQEAVFSQQVRPATIMESHDPYADRSVMSLSHLWVGQS